MRTRRPTGEASWPTLIVEGVEGAGKTYAALDFTADERVGAAYVVEVGEHRVDEYGAALGDFEIVEHDGSLREVVAAVRDVMAQPPLVDGLPTVLVVDSATAWWDLVKREAERIARSSKSAQSRLREDPHAEIEVGHQAWNRAKDWAWWQVINDLRAWQGLTILTARADEVSKFVDGRPVADQTEYRIEVERGTPFAVDGIVRMRHPAAPLVTVAKSLRPEAQLGQGGKPVESLAEVVFDVFGAGGQAIVLDSAAVKRALVAEAKNRGHAGEAATAAARAAWDAGHGNRVEFTPADLWEIAEGLPAPESAEDPVEGPETPADAEGGGSDPGGDAEAQEAADGFDPDPG